MSTIAEEFRAEGRTGTIAWLLQLRFGGELPEVVRDRLEQASTEDLDIWGARLFDAESLEAVFDTASTSLKRDQEVPYFTEDHTSAVAALREAEREEKRPSILDEIFEECRAEGRVEGQARGIAKLLTWQLRHKFGTVPLAVQYRLVWASAKELDEWSIRLFDAESLEAVFDDASYG